MTIRPTQSRPPRTDSGAGAALPAAPAGSLPPALALRRLLLGYRLSQALFVAAELGLADLLADGPQHVDALAQAVGAPPRALYRLLRLLASEGVFVEVDGADQTFALTPLAEPLRRDVADSLRARALFDGAPWQWQAWSHLLHSVRTGASAFTQAHGLELFAYLQQHPAAAATFHHHMAVLTLSWVHAVLDAYDFSGVHTLVDVGAGHGALLTAILQAYPQMHGILFDQPHVVGGAAARLEAAGVAARCTTVAGDFFAAVPAGEDAYLLKNILHDWDDERCRTILQSCRRALPEQGRLLVVEALIPPGNAPDYAKYLDVTIMMLTCGRERSREEYAALLAASGFRLARVTPTSSELSVMEAVPVS